jgi:hypothetical protein
MTLAAQKQTITTWCTDTFPAKRNCQVNYLKFDIKILKYLNTIYKHFAYRNIQIFSMQCML